MIHKKWPLNIKVGNSRLAISCFIIRLPECQGQARTGDYSCAGTSVPETKGSIPGYQRAESDCDDWGIMPRDNSGNAQVKGWVES